MIIQCEQCQTKFKLDDSKVTEKGVKVRCAKCKHVFTVRKEEPEQDLAAAFAPEDTVAFTPPPREEESAPVSRSFDFDDQPAFGEVPPSEEPFDAAAAFDTGSTTPAADSFGANDEFSLSSLEDDKGFATAHDDQADGDGMDFDGFDFGDTDKTMLAAPAASVADEGDRTMIQAAPVPVAKQEPQGLDFSDDSMFGAVVAPPSEEEENAISFDFPMGDFADSMEATSTGKPGAVSLDTPGDTPFSLGEIDFGDELTSVAVQQVNPDELKPSQESLFGPLAAAQTTPDFDLGDDTLKHAFAGSETVAPTTSQEELPPLSISSRRKQSPLVTGLAAALAVVAVGALGYVGYNSMHTGKETAAPESGKITVKDVKASYVKSKQAGELLVISGEAVNQFAQPRAALQVKGMVYDAKGQVLSSKTAYCGNLLTNEQLADMPLDKIEAAMTNQFGDSLANLEVAPGKTVPFVIVVANPSKDAKDYGVQPSGSTVATGKQP